MSRVDLEYGVSFHFGMSVTECHPVVFVAIRSITVVDSRLVYNRHAEVDRRRDGGLVTLPDSNRRVVSSVGSSVCHLNDIEVPSAVSQIKVVLGCRLPGCSAVGRDFHLRVIAAIV